MGVGIAVGGSAALGAVGKVAPRIAGSGLGRAAVNALVGAAVGFGTSGGQPKQALEGAAFGGAFSLGSEYLFTPVSEQIRFRLPSSLGGIGEMETGASTIGKNGQEARTFLSDPLEALGGKQLRIVTDVTELPIGQGRTVDDLVDELVGKHVSTGHATLQAADFDLSAGGRTLIKGFPSEAAGFRGSQELYHFYSAPSSSESDVTIYGGYMGVGEGYGEKPSRIIWGGKPTGSRNHRHGG